MPRCTAVRIASVCRSLLKGVADFSLFMCSLHESINESLTERPYIHIYRVFHLRCYCLNFDEIRYRVYSSGFRRTSLLARCKPVFL